MFLKLCTEQIQKRLKESVRISLSPENTVERPTNPRKNLKRNYRRLAIWHLKNHSVKKLSFTTTLLVLLLRNSPSRTTHFFETKVGNYELTRLLEKVPNSGEGFQLKIIINKELTGAKINITDKFGLRLVDIFKSEDHHIHQEKFYFLMDSLVERGVFTKSER